MLDDEDFSLSEDVVENYEFVLTAVDADIAEQFRKFGHGRYLPDSPLLMQISRCLMKLTSNNFNEKAVCKG